MKQLFREFKPALFFVGKFLIVYFVGNILYGLYIEAFDKRPDHITSAVTAQTVWVLNALGRDADYEDVRGAAKVSMKNGDDVVVNVFEGCNGINVMLVFLAFLIAYGGPMKVFPFFLISGVLLIHLFNLLRIGYLYHLALHNESTFYYYHKYFFTASLYLVVFGLWFIWVVRFNENRKVKASG